MGGDRRGRGSREGARRGRKPLRRPVRSLTTALLLAGERAGGDPLARSAGVPHKALIEIAGVPMLLRVVRCLSAVPAVGRIEVSSNDPSLLDAHPELRQLREAGRLGQRPSADSPAASVRNALADLAGDGPVLVTTSDHALLAPAMVEHFLAAAEGSGAEVAAAVVGESVMRARFPEARRTFIPLRGESVTGANLFWFRSAVGAEAAGFWRRTESVRKRPWRLAALFGPALLLRFALRRLDLEAATRQISARIGLPVAAVALPFAECGIDVDRPGDVALVERILSEG